MSRKSNQNEPATTEEWPTLAGEPASPSTPLDDLPFDEANEEWATAGSARGIRLRLPVVALLAVILVAAGFWGGSIVEKDQGSSAAAGAAAGLAGRFAAGGARGAGGATGATGFGAATTQGTTGTISVVDGSTLYVLTTSGSLVKVTLAPSTTVTRNAKATQGQLQPGDSVDVQGATGKSGTVTATSVAATASGVTSSGGGFAGRAGFGGAGALSGAG
jgi:hypothetical protein